IWTTVSADLPTEGVRTRVVLGLWRIRYEPRAPELDVVIAAVCLGVACAAAAAIVERIVLDRSRRSTDVERKLLAPKIVMAETRGIFAGPVTVTVLIPAHNEAASI